MLTKTAIALAAVFALGIGSAALAANENGNDTGGARTLADRAVAPRRESMRPTTRVLPRHAQKSTSHMIRAT